MNAAWEAKECDLCHIQFHKGDEVIDGAVANGQWAFLCRICHRLVGRGLGQGRGQKWIHGNPQKVEG